MSCDRWRSSGCILLLLFVASCSKQEPPRTVVARVGTVELTLDEVKAHIDTMRTPIDDQVRRYVTQWVNGELIYQEAQRKGIENADELEQRLREARRQLTNQAFLDQYVYRDDTTRIDTTAMRAYFDAHREEFVVGEDMVRINVVCFETRTQASAFAALVARGTSWSDALTKALSDTAAQVVSTTSDQFFTQRTLFPPELWKAATALGVNDVSFPVKISDGYCVLQTLGRMKQGQQADFEMVSDEVQQRLLIEHRRQRYDELVGTLRERYSVQVLLDFPTSDSVNVSFHE